LSHCKCCGRDQNTLKLRPDRIIAGPDGAPGRRGLSSKTTTKKAATHVTIVGRRFSVNAIETTLGAKISADGRHITWWSHSDRLVEGEGDSVAYDVFARD
jgi:hypothetical protein